MTIFQSLAKGPLAVNEIAQAFPVSRPAVSQHLRVLKDAGLVVHKKLGTRQIYEVNPAGIEFFERIWTRCGIRHCTRSRAPCNRRSQTVVVEASSEHAFRVFTERPEIWWPATHHIGKQAFKTIVAEPQTGGRWFEQDADGVQCDWGRVLAWEPPHRVAMSQLQADWSIDPNPAKGSEVEVRFVAVGPTSTRVELTHRGIERHGERYNELAGGWTMLLDLFAKAAQAGEKG